jgi:polyhydroxyalkanoate synthesis regulator phasin
MAGTRRKLLLVVVLLLVAAGAGAALAATQLSPRAESEAIIEDAAEQLGIEPEELSDALQQALENRLDEAVEDGRLTEEQAERLKERLEAGVMPLFRGPRAFSAPRLHRHGPRLFAALDTAAEYLDLTEAELRERLRDGDTLAEIAREEGKSVDGLVTALVAEKTERLDEAVEDGRLTEAQRDRIVASLREQVTAMVNGRLPSFRPGRFFRGPHPFGRGPLLPPREDASSGLRPVLPPVA